MTNIQDTDDNECFKWCLISYLNPADHNPRRITKADKDFTKRLDFKDMKLSVKIRDILKIKKKKKKSSALAILVIRIRKNIQSMYQENVAKKSMLTYMACSPQKDGRRIIFFCLRWTSLWRTLVGEGYMGGKIVF